MSDVTFFIDWYIDIVGTLYHKSHLLSIIGTYRRHQNVTVNTYLCVVLLLSCLLTPVLPSNKSAMTSSQYA